MKNNISTLILVILIILFSLIFITSRGDGVANVDSSYTGQYRNNAKNGTHVLLEENDDGTFNVVFVKFSSSSVGAVKMQGEYYPVQLDSIERNGNTLKYVSSFDNDELQIDILPGTLTILNGKTLGNEEFAGTYTKVRNIKDANPENFKDI